MNLENQVLRELIEFIDFKNNIFLIVRNSGFLLFVERSFQEISVMLRQS